jgi:hypothetical protein
VSFPSAAESHSLLTPSRSQSIRAPATSHIICECPYVPIPSSFFHFTAGIPHHPNLLCPVLAHASVGVAFTSPNIPHSTAQRSRPVSAASPDMSDCFPLPIAPLPVTLFHDLRQLGTFGSVTRRIVIGWKQTLLGGRSSLGLHACETSSATDPE